MANFTATDWSLVVDDRNIVFKKRRNKVTMTLGTGANDGYPAGGIPIPTTVGDYGMVRNLDYVHIIDANSASGIVWKTGVTGNVFRGYRQGSTTGAILIELGTATVMAGQVFIVEAVGW